MLQDEHGGPVVLRPLVPHPVVEPHGARLALAADEEEGEALGGVVVKVGPVPLVPLPDNKLVLCLQSECTGITLGSWHRSGPEPASATAPGRPRPAPAQR